jgi:nucleotide-binding universal stress UspA family protein
MIEKILCATDGSHSARKAVHFAASLARQCGARVAFVAVNSVTEEKLRSTTGWISSDLGVTQAKIRGKLDNAREVAERAGAGFNHIVMGSAGRKGLMMGALIGSVTWGVIIQAAYPVTVVR